MADWGREHLCRREYVKISANNGVYIRYSDIFYVISKLLPELKPRLRYELVIEYYAGEYGIALYYPRGLDILPAVPEALRPLPNINLVLFLDRYVPIWNKAQWCTKQIVEEALKSKNFRNKNELFDDSSSDDSVADLFNI